MVQTSADAPAQGGIVIENVRSALRSDTNGEDGRGQPFGAEPSPSGPQPEPSPDNIPLDPRILKFSVGAIGSAAAEITRYPGWRFTEDELAALTDALAELGFRLPVWGNLMLVCVSIGAGKVAAYAMWLRMGKPPLAESTRRLLESAPASDEPAMPEPQQ